MKRADSTRDAIREYIGKSRSATGPELASHLGISRQAVNSHLRKLIAAGEVFKTGSTRAARYFPAGAAPPARHIRRDLALPSLDEAEVYAEFSITLNLSQLASNVEAIMRAAARA